MLKVNICGLCIFSIFLLWFTIGQEKLEKKTSSKLSKEEKNFDGVKISSPKDKKLQKKQSEKVKHSSSFRETKKPEEDKIEEQIEEKLTTPSEGNLLEENEINDELGRFKSLESVVFELFPNISERKKEYLLKVFPVKAFAFVLEPPLSSEQKKKIENLKKQEKVEKKMVKDGSLYHKYALLIFNVLTEPQQQHFVQIMNEKVLDNLDESDY